MDDLEQRVKMLESKVKLLEETLNTLKNMSLSEQMGSYIQSRSKSLKMVDLINSMSETRSIDFDKERESFNNVQAAKRTVDAQIAQALRNMGTFSEDFPDDPRYFNYEVESGETTSTFGRKEKNRDLSQYVSKGIRITAYNGFETKRVIVPNEIDGQPVISIGEKAFINTPISEVILPKSLKAILEGAFEGCKKIKHIDLPDSVEYLGPKCFCKSGIVEFNCPNFVRIIPSMCFYQCAELRKINLGNQVWKLGHSAFSECSNLQNISLPESLQVIEASCFEETKIDTIIFPGNVTNVSREGFGNRFTRNSNHVICVFLGKDTTVDMKSFESFYRVSLIYCLPGSRIQQIARECSIPMKPLSEFRMEDHQ